MGILSDVLFYGAGLAVFLAAFWVYFDGLDRISNVEANLWAVAVLFGSASAIAAAESAPIAALAAPLPVVLYLVRTGQSWRTLRG